MLLTLKRPELWNFFYFKIIKYNNFIFFNTVGGEFTNRRKEIDYPDRRLETEPKLNDPIVTTEVSIGSGNGVLIMDAKNENRQTSFFAQPGILAGKV